MSTKGTTGGIPCVPISSHRQPKRMDKDNISQTKPAKRPRTLDSDANLLFGDTEDLDEDDLLDLDSDSISTSTTATSDKQPRRAAHVTPPAPAPIVRYRRVLRHVPNVPFIPLTSANGDRLYLRLHPDGNNTSLEVKVMDPRKVKIVPKPYKSILGVDFHALRREAELVKERFNQLVENLTKVDVKEELTSQEKENMEIDELDAELFGVQPPVAVGNDETVGSLTKAKGPTPVEAKLWVEKYRPKSYMDLLSEGSVNHALLHWLKLWDKCVFGKDYLAKHKEIKEKYAKLEAKEKEKDPWRKVLVQDDAYDELGRPKQTVVLLHGPAGLGKTTAAHVIAKHAGYNVIELNASDDRSVDVFRKVLDSTTQSRSEMFQDGRPNCLVIDEIDGSPTATVDVLVNLVSGKAKESGKTKNKKTLRRPVICICNDLYAPALKNLRLVALVLQFHPILVSSLVERIEEISLKEEMAIDNGTLHCIAEKSDCDIRSCLSTMQFIKQKNGKVTHSFLNQLGTKDKSKGLFAVWEDIFFLPQAKRYYDSADPTKAEARFSNVLRTVQNFGDYEKLLAGFFENYLKTKFRDSYFETILTSLEWSIWFTEIQDKINILQNYSLLGFLPMYFVFSHFLCAGRVRFPLQYPNNTVHTQSSRFTASFKAQLGDISAPIGRYLDMNNATLDIFPSMLSIIQPSTIRPIPSQLWSPSERECLQNIVNIMLGYHLTYTQQRTPEGTYVFLLDPNIEELARFPSEEVSSRKQFPYAIKQMISREIDIEKMRQEEPNGSINEKEILDKVNHNPVPTSKPPSQAPEALSSPPQIPNWKQPSYKLDRVITPTTKPVIAKDFFGRPIVRKLISPEQEKLQVQKAKASDIWYRYKEGFSNAVRKKLKIKDLL